MDYTEAQAAFFGAREGQTRELDWSSPARRLRDAIEPLATICFWSEPAYDAYAARGLDFLQGYVWGRASALGEPDPAVAAAAFGVFEPGLIADVYAAGRSACALSEIRAARAEGSSAALRAVLGDPSALEGLEETTAALRSAAEAAPSLGRALFAGLAGQAWPQDPYAALWHACSLLREHRGDAHLAATTLAGLDGVQANALTELWIGWEPTTYTGSRGWSPEAMAAGAAALEARGLVRDGALTAAGSELREELETATDDAERMVVEVLGDDLDSLVTRLGSWSQQVIDHGWFPPDPYKRAAG